MFRRLGLLVAALALFSLAGGQWGVAQGAAWARMVIDYTQQTGSIGEAVSQTFDGQHPCELCKQIAAAKSAEPQKSPAKAAEKNAKKDGVLNERVDVAPHLVGCAVWLGAVSSPAMSWAECPPTPPPRA